MTWVIAAIGVMLTLVNVWYGMSKDAIQKGEAEIKECIDTIKKALQDALDKNININLTYTYIESLAYLRLINENNLRQALYGFAEKINDFCDGGSEEDLFGEYKVIIEKIYTMKISTWKYICFVLFPQIYRK